MLGFFLGNCYIAECGCPGAFLEDWCDKTKLAGTDWCRESESNCNLGGCGGTWCTGERITTASSGIAIL
jgi:hypothetical protein